MLHCTDWPVSNSKHLCKSLCTNSEFFYLAIATCSQTVGITGLSDWEHCSAVFMRTPSFDIWIRTKNMRNSLKDALEWHDNSKRGLNFLQLQWPFNFKNITTDYCTVTVGLVVAEWLLLRWPATVWSSRSSSCRMIECKL